MSSSVRVKTATPAPSRWTWIRIPSIFHSTAAGETRSKAAATLLADAASIGRSGRPTRRPNDRSAADAAPGDAAAGRAAAATAGRDPPSRCARLTSGRHPGGAGDRLDHHPFERALVQFPGDQPDEEVAFARGGPPERPASRRLRADWAPAPVTAPTSANTASTSLTVRAGALSSAARPR